MPGTATTSSPRTTSGHASRSERGTFASTNRSCTFTLLPASRSPARQPRTWRPGSSDSIVQAPQRTAPESATGPCSSHTWSYSRTAWRPAPRSIRCDPSREASNDNRAFSMRLREPSLGAGAQQIRVGGGVQAAEQRQDLVADQAALRCPDSTCPCGTSSPSRGSTPRSRRARRRAAGGRRRRRGGARSRRVLAARDELVEHGLDLVRGGVASGAEAAALRDPVANLAQRGLLVAAPRSSITSAPSTSRQKRASSSDSAPRRPWFTCTADTR